MYKYHVLVCTLYGSQRLAIKAFMLDEKPRARFSSQQSIINREYIIEIYWERTPQSICTFTSACHLIFISFYSELMFSVVMLLVGWKERLLTNFKRHTIHLGLKLRPTYRFYWTKLSFDDANFNSMKRNSWVT